MGIEATQLDDVSCKRTSGSFQRVYRSEVPFLQKNANNFFLGSDPETTHKHVFSILSTSSHSSHKRPKAQIGFYRMDIEFALCKCKSCPLYRTQYIRCQMSQTSRIHHSIKKKVGPPAGPHHFINANMFQNPFFLDIWIV